MPLDCFGAKVGTVLDLFGISNRQIIVLMYAPRGRGASAMSIVAAADCVIWERMSVCASG